MEFISVASNKSYCHFCLWQEVQWCQAEKEKKASQHVLKGMMKHTQGSQIPHQPIPRNQDPAFHNKF
jgi:hypothetical protein